MGFETTLLVHCSAVYLGFPIFRLWAERTWWRWTQRRIVRNNFNIYVFVILSSQSSDNHTMYLPPVLWAVLNIFNINVWTFNPSVTRFLTGKIVFFTNGKITHTFGDLQYQFAYHNDEPFSPLYYSSRVPLLRRSVDEFSY